MRVMLLNDGETYTNVEGCKILVVEDEDLLDSAAGIEAGIASGAIIVEQEF